MTDRSQRPKKSRWDRLKDRLREWANELEDALAPAPEPVPVPIPNR